MSETGYSWWETPICFKDTLDYYSLENHLWSGAKDRWQEADDETKEQVYHRLIDYFGEINNADSVPDITTINDFIWFECDDLFYPTFEITVYDLDSQELKETITGIESLDEARKLALEKSENKTLRVYITNEKSEEVVEDY